jgi:cytidine deaminase
MSLNPFTADPAVRSSFEALSRSVGAAVRAEVKELLSGPRDPAENMGSVLPRTDVDRLVARHGLGKDEMLMRLLVEAARTLADPPISSFFVGAVGLERETGNLILGGNLEFPGTHLGLTVHGEGFVATRAFTRGTSLDRIALGEAHPCAHCRQYLSEFAWAGELVLIDLPGHRLALRELYPWPFDPAYLGETGAVPGAVNGPDLLFGSHDLDAAVANALLAAARRAHAPYSKCPGAVALTLADGNVVTGSAVESVAFNPTMQPLPAALINLRAHGYGQSDIDAAALATRIGGAVDYARATAELLAAVAPGVDLAVVGIGP